MLKIQPEHTCPLSNNRTLTYNISSPSSSREALRSVDNTSKKPVKFNMGFCVQLQRCCCAFTVLFPKLVCYGFYLWAGYTFCWQICYQHLGGFLGLILGIVGLYLTVAGILAYYMTVHMAAGSALDHPELQINFKNLEDELAIGDLTDDSIAKHIAKGTIEPPPQYFLNHTFTIKSSGTIRYCDKCKVWKPDRCHHCSTCKQCVLKMDHHCPWFATCIGYKNHKFFIQFLTYTVIYSALCCATTFNVLYNFFFTGEYLHHYFSINWILMFIFGAAFFIAVGAFDGFSIYQLLCNRTTLETYDYTRYRVNLNKLFDDYYAYSNKPNSDQYGNLFSLPTKAENWRYVMGSNWFEWCLPVINQPMTKDYYLRNGLCFPVNLTVYNELVYNSRLQLQLATELQNYRMRRMNAMVETNPTVTQTSTDNIV